LGVGEKIFLELELCGMESTQLSDARSKKREWRKGMSSNALVKTLYSALLRLASSFDQKRASKALIYRVNSERNYKNPSTLYYSSIVTQLLGNTPYYPPQRLDLSFKTILRQEFRKSNPPNLSTADRITAGFAFLRKFSHLWSQYEASTGRPRKRIPKEEKFAIHFETELKTGAMLCAHPMVPGYMQRAIVLLLEHTDKGSYGVIINKKTDHTVETGTLNLPLSLQKLFQNNPAFFGGNIPRCQILHPFPSCGGRPIPGCNPSTQLYDFAQGNLEKVIEVASEGPAIAEQFQFFIGCCVWKAGMLEQEMKDGTWIVAGGEVDQILAHARQEPLSESYAVLKRSRAAATPAGTPAISQQPQSDADAASSSPSPSPSSGTQKDIYEGPNETWSRMLWSLSRQTNHFAHLDPNLDSAVVESIDWHYSDEGDDDDEDEDDDEESE
jgi:putative transcriptional regulator